MKTQTKRTTLSQECTQLCDKLKPVEKLIPKIRELAGKYHKFNLENSKRITQDGTTICMKCGFPVVGETDTCPNCGAYIHTVCSEKKNGKNICYISFLSQMKGKLHDYIVHRQFIVESYISQTFQHIPERYVTEITEVYRNFIAENGKTWSMRRGLNPFPYYNINPYNTTTELKHVTRGAYDYGSFPRYTDLSWNELSGKRLLPELNRRLKNN